MPSLLDMSLLRLAEKEADTCAALPAGISPYHTATALQRGAQAAREARALRAEVADLAAQLAADQLELARLRALEGL
jgi:hypothetical protein